MRCGGWWLALCLLAACGTKREPVQFLDVSEVPAVSWCRDLQPILARRCTGCHASTATARGGAPTGVDFDSYAATKASATRGLARVEAGTMPPGGMPEPERAVFRAWVNGGMADCPAGGDDPGPSGDETAMTDPGPEDPGAAAGTTWCRDIQGLVGLRCSACHAGATVSKGVLLDGYANVVVNIARANQQIQGGYMPPGGLSSGERAAFQAWVDAGTPECATGDDVPPVTDPGPPVATCTSGTHWTLGNEGSPWMRPGGDCMGCHAHPAEPGEDLPPQFTMAGTVMRALHDEDDCNGAPGVTVRVLGPDGAMALYAVSNEAGNFSQFAAMPPSYTVELLRAGQVVNRMQTAQGNPDCMACHTTFGANGAPGRVWAP